MSRVIVDASVVVKWYITEKHSTEALELRKQFVEGQIELYAPDLLPYEVLNALKYSQLFNPKELELAIASLEEYGIVQIPLNGAYARHVVRIANTYDISIYDAAYIGLLEVLDAKVYTADKHLLEKLDDPYWAKVVYIPNLKEKK